MLLWFFSIVAKDGYIRRARGYLQSGVFKAMEDLARQTNVFEACALADNYASAFPSTGASSLIISQSGDSCLTYEYDPTMISEPRAIPILMTYKLHGGVSVNPGTLHVFDQSEVVQSQLTETFERDVFRTFAGIPGNISRDLVKVVCDLGLTADRVFVSAINNGSIVDLESAFRECLTQAQASEEFAKWASIRETLIGSISEPGPLVQLISLVEDQKHSLERNNVDMDRAVKDLLETRKELVNASNNLSLSSGLVQTGANRLELAIGNVNSQISSIAAKNLSLSEVITSLEQKVSQLSLEDGLGQAIAQRFDDLNSLVKNKLGEFAILNDELRATLESRVGKLLDTQNSTLTNAVNEVLNQYQQSNDQLLARITKQTDDIMAGATLSMSTQTAVLTERVSNFQKTLADLLVSLSEYKRDITAKVVDWVKSVSTITELDASTLQLLDVLDRNITSIELIRDSLAELSLESSSLAAFSINAASLTKTLNEKLPDAAEYHKLLNELVSQLKVLASVKLTTSSANDVASAVNHASTMMQRRDDNIARKIESL